MGTLPPKVDLPASLEALVWRYMDFTKFVSMLESGGLFVPRADLLGDPYEGTFSRLTKLYWEEYEKLHAFPLRGGRRITLPEFLAWSRKWTYISAWHLSEHESAAMWRLYGLKGNTVAVRSSYKLLKDCLPDTFLIGRVRYIDYDEDLVEGPSVWLPYFYKRRSFEHEKELRAVKIDTPKVGGEHDLAMPQTKTGLLVHVDLNILIERIYVDPSAATWLTELVRDVANRYGVRKEVVQSSLESEPPY